MAGCCHSALLSLAVLALGSGAVLLCRQPARRLRIIELSLAGCLLAPLLGMIPGYPQLGIAWSHAEPPPPREISAADVRWTRCRADHASAGRPAAFHRRSAVASGNRAGGDADGDAGSDAANDARPCLERRRMARRAVLDGCGDRRRMVAVGDGRAGADRQDGIGRAAALPATVGGDCRPAMLGCGCWRAGWRNSRSPPLEWRFDCCRSVRRGLGR